MVTHAARAAAIAIPLLGLAAACNAIIGITDVPVPVDGGDGGVQTDNEASLPPSEGGDGTTTTPGSDASDATSVATGDSGDGANGGGTDGSRPCTDTQMDSHNCGRCGHDCLGGACVQGHCQAVALVSSDAGVTPFGLAQDDAYLYWTDLKATGSVNRTSKDAGSTLPVSPSAVYPRTVVVDDAGVVFWGESSGIYRCAHTGCSGNPLLVATGNSVSSLAIDGNFVYWSEGAPQILRAHQYGSNETGATLWQGDAATNEVAADGQRVYFTAQDGLLHAIGVDGGAPATASWGNPLSSGSQGIAVYGGDVYWTVADPTQGSILAAPTSTLTVGTVAASQQDPQPVATDGANVYWANVNIAAQSAVILGCSIANCPSPTQLFQRQASNAVAMVVDDRSIYWTDSYNGSLWMLAK
jgi:hypothetical protein